MTDYQEILTHASQLSVVNRLRLIDELASTVPDNEPPHLSPEWLSEIHRRSDEIASGQVQAESWAAIRERLFAKHGVCDAG